MVKGSYDSWPVEKIVVKDNVRKNFNEEGLGRHAESLKKKGQLRPLLVLRDGTLVAGERTLRAAKLNGWTHVDVKILDGAVSPHEVKKLQLVENLMREGLEDPEIYLAVKDLVKDEPGLLKKDLMAELGFDPSMATRIFSVDEIIPEAREAFLRGAFGFAKAYALKKASTEEQHQMLAAILSGTSRDEIERQRKKSRNATATSAKLSRVKIEMPEATLVITGKELSMADVVELLTETLKEARKAAEQYDVKTFQSMMKDKAKAGG